MSISSISSQLALSQSNWLWSLGQSSTRSQTSDQDTENLLSLLSDADTIESQLARFRSQEDSRSNPMEQDFAALDEALAAGNLEEAQAAWQTIQTHMAGHRPPEGKESDDATLEDAFDALSAALESGDTAEAAELWCSLKTELEAKAPPPPPAGPPPQPSSGEEEEDYASQLQNRLFESISQLYSTLGSDDTQSTTAFSTQLKGILDLYL